MVKKCFFCLFFLLFSAVCYSDDNSNLINIKSSPVQFAFYEFAAFPNNINLVKGLRFGLYGKIQYVSGFDLSIIGETTEINSSIQLGLFNISNVSTGVSLGLVSTTKKNCGLQFSLVQLSNTITGLSVGVIYNEAVTQLDGNMLGLINNAGEMSGLQIGAINSSKKMSSLQIGIINIAEEHSNGMQLGLINLSNGSFFPFIKF